MLGLLLKRITFASKLVGLSLGFTNTLITFLLNKTKTLFKIFFNFF
jgi:hypothetical protein